MATEQEIRDTYKEVLGRDADPSGLQARGYQSVDEIRASLYASDEFKNQREDAKIVGWQRTDMPGVDVQYVDTKWITKDDEGNEKNKDRPGGNYKPIWVSAENKDQVEKLYKDTNGISQALKNREYWYQFSEGKVKTPDFALDPGQLVVLSDDDRKNLKDIKGITLQEVPGEDGTTITVDENGKVDPNGKYKLYGIGKHQGGGALGFIVKPIGELSEDIIGGDLTDLWMGGASTVLDVFTLGQG